MQDFSKFRLPNAVCVRGPSVCVTCRRTSSDGKIYISIAQGRERLIYINDFRYNIFKLHHLLLYIKGKTNNTIKRIVGSVSNSLNRLQFLSKSKLRCPLTDPAFGTHILVLYNK